MVTVVNKAGHGKDFAFPGLPVPEPMQRSLATVFAAQQVRWTSHYSATAAWNRLMPEHRWHQRWYAHWQRLDDLADKVGRPSWAAARVRASDTDRTLVDLLLKGQLAS
ncbi:hypothetical protein BIV24_24035 [Streptomyces colonosanans]|uniref:Uncharacterized protein n=2 Tax=Streptomyces colonosanans TaxID=1428652 RepID=A0A1S2P2Y1_9ACTN|nr:hypothetical protein BIV24_24035 [Streptomyces colonosanans]